MLHHTSAHCTCKIRAVRQVSEEVQLILLKDSIPTANTVFKTSYGSRAVWASQQRRSTGQFCSQIHRPWMGDIVGFGRRLLLYRPAMLHSLACRYDTPMPESTLSPLSGTVNLATGYSEKDRKLRNSESTVWGILRKLDSFCQHFTNLP